MSRGTKIVRMRRGRFVLQRRAAPIVAVCGVVGIAIMGAAVVPEGIDRNTGFEMFLFGSFLLAAMRGIWRALVRPRIILHEDHLENIDFIWRWHISFNSIRLLDSEKGLTMTLKDGRDVSAFAFSASLIDRGRTCEAAARRIRKSMSERGRSGGKTQTAQRKFDFTLADIAFVPFFVLLAFAIFMGE